MKPQARTLFQVEREENGATWRVSFRHQETGDLMPLVGGLSRERAAAECSAAMVLGIMFRSTETASEQLASAMASLKKAAS